MNRLVLPLLLSLGLLFGTHCRNAPEERQAAGDQDAGTAATQPSPAASPIKSEATAGNGSAGPLGRGSGSAAPQKPKEQLCNSDGDCTLSRFIPGDCCQDCEERPMLRSEYEAKEASCAEALARCPMRNCAPRKLTRRVACVAGSCQLAGRDLPDSR